MDSRTMLIPAKFSHNAFEDWPAFRAELEEALRVKLHPEAVERVMARTRSAYSRLQFASITGAFRPQDAEQIRRYEAFSGDFTAVQMKLLSILIGSFSRL